MQRIVVLAMTMMLLGCFPARAELTQVQIDNINILLSNVNTEVNTVINAREDVNALLRIHNEIPDNALLVTILNAAKSRALTAAQALVTLLQ